MASVTTIESIDLGTAIAVVNQTDQQPFSRDKLFISIYESCKHRNDALSSATALTNTIIGRLYPLISSASIQNNDIILMTSEVLKRFDPVAGMHYEAYHRK